MAKRRASKQLTKDSLFAGDESSGESDEVHGVAAPDVLAKRKFAVPRARRTRPTNEQPRANPFSNMSSKASTPFSFLAPTAPSTLSFGTSSSPVHSDRQLEFRALNTTFAAKIASLNTHAGFEDFSSICQKYLRYARQINGVEADPVENVDVTVEIPSTRKSIMTEPSDVSNPPNRSAGSVSMDVDVAVEVPPVEKKPLFSFGTASQNLKEGTTFDGSRPAVPASLANVDKSSAVFSFGKPTSEPAPVFKFGAAGASIADLNKENKQKDDPAKNDDSDLTGSAEESSNKPGVGTSASGNKSGAGALKSVGSEEDKAQPLLGNSSQPGFAFGKASNDKHAFSFNPTSKPFSFKGDSVGADGASNGEESATKSAKPPFAFGSTSSEAATPSGSDPDNARGSDAASSKPSLSLPSLAGDVESKPLPFAGQPFSFVKDSGAAKPAFSFGSSASPAESKPFSLGASTGANAAKPAFSFGQAAPASEATGKPVFSFGKPSDTPEKPTSAFSFGKPSEQTDSAPKPAFSFGGAPGSAPAPGESKPAFSFGAADKSGSSSVFSSTGTPGVWNKSDGVQIVKEDEPEAEAEPEPQLDLTGPGPGEEDEDCVYDKKTKVFELKDGEYQTLGLGFLRVLVNRDTKKARALVRADGSGRVLLNVALRKELAYSVVGKGQVKLVDVVEGSAEPKIYVLRVKTEEDGNALKDKLEEIKN